MLASTNMPLIGFRVNEPEGKTVPLFQGWDSSPLSPDPRQQREAGSISPLSTPGDAQESGPVQPGGSSVAVGVCLSTPAVLLSCRSCQRAVLGGQDCFPSLSS